MFAQSLLTKDECFSIGDLNLYGTAKYNFFCETLRSWTHLEVEQVPFFWGSLCYSFAP